MPVSHTAVSTSPFREPMKRVQEAGYTTIDEVCEAAVKSKAVISKLQTDLERLSAIPDAPHDESCPFKR